jgi:myo-inositol 2-dehydrogenase/D-chiro-inositol 1-dehydrogenase
MNRATLVPVTQRLGGQVRIVIIGAGRMGAIRAEDLATDPRVDEVLIANRDDSRAAALATRLGARHLLWSDVDATDADGTVIALATDAHTATLPAALRHGRPVLCEKPIALSLAETDVVIAAAKESGASLQVGFQRRFDPGMRAVHDRIESGALGVVYSLSLLSHDIAPSGREFIAGSGGIFRDLHVHDFDVISWLTGSPVETVYATKAVRAHEQYAEFDDADVTVIHASTTNGVQAIVRGARHDALGHDVRVEAHGSLDSVTAGLTERTPLRTMDGALATNVHPFSGFVDRFREAFRLETAAFVDLVIGTAGNPCPPESAWDSLRVAIACEQSVASGAPVRVADVRSSNG